MSGADFIDSNVLVYAYDSQNPTKQKIGQSVIRKAILGEGMISTQVLGEFAATFLHKTSPRKHPEEILAMLDVLRPISLVNLDGDAIWRAVEAHAEYGIHIYDGMIVAAAERGGCKRILSEDLNPGQKYFNIEVANPFL